MKVSISFKWQDIWVGLFIGKGTKYPNAIYICVIPCFPVKIELAAPQGRERELMERGE